MYQNSCLRHNYERKDNIFDMQFTPHNITHDKIQKYIIIFLKYFTRDSLNNKNIYSLSYGLTSDLHIFAKVNCKLFLYM